MLIMILIMVLTMMMFICPLVTLDDVHNNTARMVSMMTLMSVISPWFLQ